MTDRVPPAKATPSQSPKDAVSPLPEESFEEWIARLRELLQREKILGSGDTSYRGSF